MKKRALIVDDNEENLYLLVSILKANGLAITVARNGREALDAARREPPDLIVSDILMPVMDGYALCREWKSDDRLRPIPFVFYTATYTDAKDEEFALSLGAELFLIKPQEPDKLMDDLKKVMSGKRPAGKVRRPPLGEEMEFFRRHDETLFRKLEKKMLDLEVANQKLKLLEENYRLSFEHVADIIAMIGSDAKFVTISPSIEKVLGYKQQDLIGRPVSDIEPMLAPDSVEQAGEDFRRILAGETVSGRIYGFLAKDGAEKYGELSGSPLFKDGRIIGLIYVARDITDRRQTEQELKQSEKKYRELFDFLPIPVYEMDLEGRLISGNRALYEVFRGTAADVEKGLRIWEILPADAIDRAHGNLGKIAKGEHIKNTEYALKRLDGTTFPAVVVSSLIEKDGRPAGFRGAVVDISALRSAEKELRRMNAFLDSIIENIPDMIFIKDAKDLRFVRVNRKTEEILGYTREKMNGKSDSDFFPKEQAGSFIQTDQQVLATRQPVDIIEESLQTKENGLRILHTKKVPILNAVGEPEYVLGISEDITERKAAEEKLRQTLVILHKAVGATVKAMASAVEARDPYTSGHQARVADLARSIAREMDLPPDQIEAIRLAASIHDIGKLSIPAEILTKPSRLTEIEYALIQEHSKRGADILKDVESPWPLAEIVHQHHERMDGSGYPRKLKGDKILIEARIIGVADVVEAMASHRPYRPGLGLDSALKEIEDNRGLSYDRDVADACLRLFRKKDYCLPDIT